MRYPLIVDSSHKIIEQIIKDWQKNPYIFYSERDIQAELYKRLSISMNLIGKETVTGLKNVRWNRVTCEPSVKYTWYENLNPPGDGDEHICKPDLVIWDDLKEQDGDFEWKFNWPILLAVELKYHYPTKKLKSISDMENWGKIDNDPETWDCTKLRALLQKHEFMYGCTVNLARNTSEDKTKYRCKSEEKGGKLWQYYACVPNDNS